MSTMTMPIEETTTDNTVSNLKTITAIAEDAYIYGLPIVVNYAVMNEYAINPDSGQYKAPFNVLGNDSRVFTYEDTSIVTPNSDTPYSMVWFDLRAEPMVISVPCANLLPVNLTKWGLQQLSRWDLRLRPNSFWTHNQQTLLCNVSKTNSQFDFRLSHCWY